MTFGQFSSRSVGECVRTTTMKNDQNSFGERTNEATNMLNGNGKGHKSDNKPKDCSSKAPKKRINKADLGPNFVPPDGGWGWFVVIAAGTSNVSVRSTQNEKRIIALEFTLIDLLTSNRLFTSIDRHPSVWSQGNDFKPKRMRHACVTSPTGPNALREAVPHRSFSSSFCFNKTTKSINNESVQYLFRVRYLSNWHLKIELRPQSFIVE